MTPPDERYADLGRLPLDVAEAPLLARNLLANMLARPGASWVATIKDVASVMIEMGEDPELVWRNGGFVAKHAIAADLAARDRSSREGRGDE